MIASPGWLVWDSSAPAAQAFLVGDPNQLPATVLSSAALEHGYNTSMFERLQAAGHPVQVTPHGLYSSTIVIIRMTLFIFMLIY